MKKYLIFIAGGIIILTIVISGKIYLQKQNLDNLKIINQVSYVCDNNKTIEATYYQGGAMPTPKPGEPPTPTGKVKVVLSDDRTLELKQTISADGARYSNGNPQIENNETFVFWSKGNTTIVLENNEEKNYKGCIAVFHYSKDLPNVYANSSLGFSVRYPDGYTIDSSYQYQALGPNKNISGIKFIVPKIMTQNTNLGPDTGISIEIIPNTDNCHAQLFLNPQTKEILITDNGIDYSFVATIEPAAGNRYEEQIWAFPNTNPCIAIRYFIHYGAIENYPPGIREFDIKALINQFDAIRRSLLLAQ